MLTLLVEKILNEIREWTGLENFDIYFCVTFDRHYILFLEKETGQEAISLSSFETFHIFRSFLGP